MQEKEIETAAKSYTADNKNTLSKNIGDKRIITLNELQQRKYISKVLNRSKNECTSW